MLAFASTVAVLVVRIVSDRVYVTGAMWQIGVQECHDWELQRSRLHGEKPRRIWN